jgi:hypothetical protein
MSYIELIQMVVNSTLSFETVSMFLINIILPATLVVTIAFLPAFIELKKPHDAGPRLVSINPPYTIKEPSFFIADVETNILQTKPTKLSAIFPVFLVNIET